MSKELFKQFIKKAVLDKQPSSGPPRPGLQWKPSTHRWIRPKDSSTSKKSSTAESDVPYSKKDYPPYFNPEHWQPFRFQVKERVGGSEKFEKVPAKGNKRLFQYSPTDREHIESVLNAFDDELLGQRAGKESTERNNEGITGYSPIDTAMWHIMQKLNLIDVGEDRLLERHVMEWFDSKPKELDGPSKKRADEYSGEKILSYRDQLYRDSKGKEYKVSEEVKDNIHRRPQVGSRIYNREQSEYEFYDHTADDKWSGKSNLSRLNLFN